MTFAGLALLLFAAFGGGFAAGRWRANAAHERLRAVRDRERAEVDVAITRLRREIVELHARNNEQSEAFQLVPDAMREMFEARSRRALLPHLVRLLDILFRPEQTAVFVARPTSRKLALAEAQGLPSSLPVGFEIEYGQGRIGYVAENRVTMDDADFRNARGEKTTKVHDVQQQIRTTEIKDLRADAVAAISDGPHTFAVLSVGGARQRRGLEKKLLGMIAGVGTAALANVTRVGAAEDASGIDGMTGLLNRPRLHERLDSLIPDALKTETQFSVLMLDVDDLRHYNETNGHLQGDDLLRQIATLIRNAVRGDDLVARYAGEEFVVVYPRADKETALRLADQLRAAIEAYPFPFRGLQPKGAVTISGGVATYPHDSKVGRDLVRQADQALADAKAAGRNRIVAAAPNYLT